MNWIRLNCDLPGSTRILQLARALRKDEVYALGAACTWFFGDVYTTTGK